MKGIASARPAVVGGPDRVLLRLAAAYFSLVAGTAPASVAVPDAGAPQIIRHSTDLGPVAASNPIEITLWLRLRDAQSPDGPLGAPHAGSTTYVSQTVDARSPAATDVATVSRFLQSQGFRVTGVGPHNLFVRAAGTVAQVDRALKVELHQYRLKDMTFRASPTGARLPAEIEPIVAAVDGLSDLGPSPLSPR
jgi:subtilase family serine protease